MVQGGKVKEELMQVYAGQGIIGKDEGTDNVVRRELAVEEGRVETRRVH
jgi:hypothetical protein